MEIGLRFHNFLSTVKAISGVFMLFFILCSQSAKSQVLRHFHLVDKETNEPIPYATIQGTQDYFTYSDEAGHFKVPYTIDHFTVRHVSYVAKLYDMEATTSDTLRMDRFSFSLNDVVVTNRKKPKKETIGNFTSKNNYSLNITRGMEMMLFFSP